MQPINLFLSPYLTGPRTLIKMRAQPFSKMDPATEAYGCMSRLITGWEPLPFPPPRSLPVHVQTGKSPVISAMGTSSLCFSRAQFLPLALSLEGRVGPRTIWFQYLWPFHKTVLSKCVCVCTHTQSPGHVWLFVTPWTLTLPGSSVHGVFQARRLEWVAISSSRGSFQLMDQAHVCYIGRRILYHWATVPCCLRHGRNYNMGSTETAGAPRNSSATIP